MQAQPRVVRVAFDKVTQEKFTLCKFRREVMMGSLLMICDTLCIFVLRLYEGVNVSVKGKTEYKIANSNNKYFLTLLS